MFDKDEIELAAAEHKIQFEKNVIWAEPFSRYESMISGMIHTFPPFASVELIPDIFYPPQSIKI